MYKNKKISAILLLSGSGNRFDSDLPKQFHNLSGKNVYLHTLNVFYKTKVFDEIILVCLKDFIEQVKKQTSNYKNIKVIPGGQTRQESSYLGLLNCEKTDYVVIHDAVRPFISEKIIFDNIEAVIKYKAVDTCIKSFDTLVQIDENRAIENIPNRNFILRGQTPQSFEFSLILNAHKDAIKQNISNATDDCQLLLNKTKIYVVDGCENNIKITTKLDLFLAEQLFRLKKVSISSDNYKVTSLENKIFAVVGASGGIGSEISDLLEKEKATVIKISKKTSEYKADISNFSDVKKVFEKIFQNMEKSMVL
ncbi:MAG: D-ribitol-5-phosphate cytidylyltransferase [Parachlamydiales bacterium]|nr:D-ribitol-5-phosphate cytidylyltransferase [Parachlamydiales bacterium]